MKYQFDLLPEEYKSSPRDNIGIALAVIAIIITIVSITWNNIKIKSAFTNVDNKINSETTNLQSIYNSINSQKPKYNEINELKKKIDFVNNNLDTPATDVVAFLNSLEICVPDSIIIKDLSPKKLTNLKETFTVSGEASTIQDILELIRNMQKSKCFIPRLKSTKSGVVEERIIQNFVLDFSYRPLVEP